VYASVGKDAGVKFKRRFKLTEFEPPTKIRWTEISTGPVITPEGATTSRRRATAGPS
jgi:hypothetical protein